MHELTLQLHKLKNISDICHKCRINHTGLFIKLHKKPSTFLMKCSPSLSTKFKSVVKVSGSVRLDVEPLVGFITISYVCWVCIR